MFEYFVIFFFFGFYLSSVDEADIRKFRRVLLPPVAFWLMFSVFFVVYFYLEFMVSQFVLATAWNAFMLLNFYLYLLCGGKLFPRNVVNFLKGE